jgi:drug/metabolite transporter (DMT)-like permease
LQTILEEKKTQKMNENEKSPNLDARCLETTELNVEIKNITKNDDLVEVKKEGENEAKPDDALVTIGSSLEADADDKMQQVELDSAPTSSRRQSYSNRFKLLVSDNNKKLLTAIQPLKAYLFGLSFAFFMCMASILIKMAPSLDGANHSAVRYVIQMLVMFVIIKKSNLDFLGARSQRKLLLLRGVVGSSAVILSYFSIKYLDVSDVETLTNSCVVITAIFSRIFLKEKLRIVHLISLVLTITGVFFIVRPSFLFGLEQDLESFFHVNLTALQHNLTLGKNLSERKAFLAAQIKDHSNRDLFESIFGVSLAILSAVCMSIAQVSIRKLCLVKVHFSITSLYPALVGLPASIAISILLIKTESSHKNLLSEMDTLAIQIVYSVCAGVCGTIGIICLNNALKYEDATKIGILKTSGVLFSFFLQYIFLDITVDFLGVFGAACVISATISIMVTKLFEERISKADNCCVQFLMIKF